MNYNMLLHSVGNIYSKNALEINTLLQNGTIATNPFFDKIIRFMTCLKTPKRGFLPIPENIEQHPLITEKIACKIFLDFYPKTIQKWISFVKDNTFSLKEYSQIKIDYVKKYYELCCCPSIIADFKEIVGGDEEVNKLPHNPVCYIMLGLNNMYQTNRQFHEVLNDLSGKLYIVQTRCANKDTASILPEFYKHLDDSKLVVKQFMLTNFPDAPENAPENAPEAQAIPQ